MMALEDAASITSDSLMAPTAPWMTRTLTSSLESFSRDAFTASTLPWTSALTMRASSLRSPACSWLKRFSRETFCTGAAALARSSALRCSTSSRAMRSSATAKKGEPAVGVSERPATSTGTEGPASVRRPPL